MLFSVLAAGILIGLIRGGKITNITHIKIRHPWLVFLSAFIEYGLLFLMRSNMTITQPIVLLSVCLQYLLLFVFIWLNSHIAYTWLVGAGSLLNFLVILLNKGAMPLSEAAMAMNVSSKNLQYLANGQFLTYRIVNENTVLAFLGDVIYVPAPFKAFLSIGDIVLFAGILLLIQSIITSKTQKEKAAE
jgi:hypothetical protein